MDWKRIRRELRAATIAAADDLLASLGGERLYALCLQTDEGGMSVGPCANTEAGFVAKRAAEAEVEEMTSAYEAWLRWNPAEWRYEMFGGAHFADLDRDFAATATGGDEADFDLYFDTLVEAMIEALAHLRAERGEALADVTLFATITDSEEAEAVEDRSSARVNPPGLAAAFARRHSRTSD